jgi:hypothetical protein
MVQKVVCLDECSLTFSRVQLTNGNSSVILTDSPPVGPAHCHRGLLNSPTVTVGSSVSSGISSSFYMCCWSFAVLLVHIRDSYVFLQHSFISMYAPLSLITFLALKSGKLFFFYPLLSLTTKVCTTL